MRLDMEKFKEELEKAPGYCLESDLIRLGLNDVPVRVLQLFDKLMFAEDTEELKDYTDEEVLLMARHAKTFKNLYSSQRFLSKTTFSRLFERKSVRKRRVL